MTIWGRETCLIVPLEIIGDAEAEFADDSGVIAAAVVVAGEFEVGGWGLAGAGVVDAIVVGPFEVAVVVVGGEDVVGEVLVGIAGAPFCVLPTISKPCYIMRKETSILPSSEYADGCWD